MESGPTPIAVLLTFNEHEARAVWQEFTGKETNPASESADSTEYYQLGSCGGFRLIHRHSAQGPLAAYESTSKAIQRYNPEIVVAVGIAFGVDQQQQRISDVLAAEAVFDYEKVRMEPDGTPTFLDYAKGTSVELIDRVRKLSLNDSDENPMPKIHRGIVLSGAKLIDNEHYRDSLCRLQSRIVGGEMEGSGLQQACADQGVDGIVLKGICDWADGDKNNPRKEIHQRQAARAAATVTRAVLERGPLTGGGRHGNHTEAKSKPRNRTPETSKMGRYDEVTKSDLCIKDASAAPFELKSGLNSKHDLASASPAGTPVVRAMLDWARDTKQPQLFALLGEYGMGKTVSCQRFVQELSRQREADPTWPMPLYFNLKTIADPRLADSLKNLVTACMQKGWLPSNCPDYNWTAFRSWLAQTPCVVVFDGLDEILVKLDEGQGETLLEELLSTLRLLEDDEANARNKLVLSCRTQYFKTLAEQRSFFLERDRGELDADSYRAMTLLPLTEEQTRKYLSKALPGQDPERLFELIESVHNLRELAQRPFTLKLIRENILELEKMRATGQPVHAVTLYSLLVERWLLRDKKKHFIRPEHKREFMAELAAWLWREGRAGLPATEAEVVFHRWLGERPYLGTAYPASLSISDRQRLAEDLRTATFLAREDRGKESIFRFAHTSLSEYFLASYLLSAIIRDDRAAWAMRTPSTETLDFLGQLLAEEDDPSLLNTLEGWLSPYLKDGSELLLRYTLHARNYGHPAPNLAGIELPGVDLDEADFLGSTEDPLNLAGANFSGAELRRTAFAHVNLAGANFSKAKLNQAIFYSCHTAGCDWQAADISGAAWQLAEKIRLPAD